MKLVVGLGNPGPQYLRTRHNVGFDAVDRLARRLAPPTSSVPKGRFGGLALEVDFAGEKVMLLKPLTFMNLSGQSVAEATRFYKLDATTQLFVLVDDIALPCGSIRIRGEGSAGGHNGLSDIESKLGSAKYARCRIGIDAPGRIPQADYVLGKFREEQQAPVDEAINTAVDATLCWLQSGLTDAMNRFNRRSADETPRSAELNS
ncbi:MAG: aminoacyl-tRNA hydrolase [Phycisphaerales bacterium]|nr:aminoacyl-tRNA hydrolase [Phycisphaerales bacterium]